MKRHLTTPPWIVDLILTPEGFCTVRQDDGSANADATGYAIATVFNIKDAEYLVRAVNSYARVNKPITYSVRKTAYCATRPWEVVIQAGKSTFIENRYSTEVQAKRRARDLRRKRGDHLAFN